MMKRRVGIQGLQLQQKQQQQFKEKGTELEAANLTQMRAQLEVFKTNLEEFAKKYKKEINKNPEFRAYFVNMCNKIGVDPIASNKGFWSEMLGVGDFYYELAVQIIQVCLKTKSRNGGIIELNELCDHLQKMRGKNSQQIIPDDIERSARKLKTLGNGFQVISIGSRKVIQSVPCELNTDHTALMSVAQEKGWVTVSSVEKELQWKKDRIDAVLSLLMRESMVWVDDQSELGERQYWFPSFVGGSLNDS